MSKPTYRVGTSGYSFADWVGPFYPGGTRQDAMFDLYAKRFETVEVNYTFYRMPAARTMASLARRSPSGFEFWVKANQKISHERNVALVPEFLANIAPLGEAGKLAGVLVQFPQSFHRTRHNRSFLGELTGALAGMHAAIEFRHHSWQHPDTLMGLRAHNLTAVVPDVPSLPGLYRSVPMVTTSTGYLRFHSRDPSRWYGGAAARYDYDYNEPELIEILRGWNELAPEVDRVYAFFNNCHGGQAARNAESFRRILGQIE